MKLRLRGGLPTQFCSDDCRSNYHNISRQLRRTESMLMADAAANGTADAPSAKLRLVRWHLSRFDVSGAESGSD